MRMAPRTAAMIADYRAGMSRKQVAKKYGILPASVDNCFKEHGVKLDRAEALARMSTKKPKPCAPAPADFATIAPTLHYHGIAAHYGVSVKIVQRWVGETGIKSKQQERARPMPDDFVEMTRKLTKTQLVTHYQTGDRAVERWLKEAGVKPKVWNAQVIRTDLRTKFADEKKVQTEHDDAAYVLRKFFVVHRCNDRGGYDPKGKFWRVGINICSPDELLVKAERYRERAA